MITSRRLIQLLAVLLMVFMVVGVAGCGDTEEPDDPVDTTPDDDPPVQTDPDEPVELVVAIWSDMRSLDPHEVHAEASHFATVMYDRLVGFDEESNIVPELATDWSVSEDGLTWTFDIRQGETFHDGTPVNAEAIRLSFARLMDEDNEFMRRTIYNSVSEWNVIDEYTFQIVTETVEPFMLYKLADLSGSIVSPTYAASVDLETFGLEPVGSGPFKFVEWVRDEHIILEKDPDHWMADESNVDTMIFRPIPEVTSRAIALETGEIDFSVAMDATEARRLGEDDRFIADNSPIVRNMTIFPNLLIEPFSDVRVRHAIAHAIDKEAIIEGILPGFATVADSVMTPGIWAYAPQPVFEYDPDKARQLLADAGYPDGFSCELRVPLGRIGGMDQIAEAVANMLGQVGIDVELDTMEHAAWVASLRNAPEDANHELTFWTWGTMTGEPDYCMRLQFHTNNWSPTCCNRGFYSNPDVDALLDEAAETVDMDRLEYLYQEAQRIVWEEQGKIPIYNLTHTVVHREGVTGVRNLPIERWCFRRAWVD